MGAVFGDLREALQTDAGPESRRALMWTVALAVGIVAAAGLTGTTHFAGVRWYPHLHLSLRGGVHHGVARPPAGLGPKLPRTRAVKATGIGPVLLWAIVGIVVIAIAVVLWRWWAGRPSRAAREPHAVAVHTAREVPVEPEPEPDTPVLQSGIELALALLDDSREPADAIVRAWLGLQDTAQDSGIVRGPAETPTEFTSRILSRAFADDRAIRTLLRLYLRTRFSDHPVTSADVASVRAALEQLVRTWTTPQPPAPAGRR